MTDRNRRPLVLFLAAAVVVVLVAAVYVACREPEQRAAPLDVASLPTLGETQRQMLDLVYAAHSEVQRIAPASAPWKWVNSYSTSPCAAPLTGQGEAMYLPDLVSSAPLTPAEWERAFPAIEKIAVTAGLTQYWTPKAFDDDFRLIEFRSHDGRTLRVLAGDNVLLTATIFCRRSLGVIRGADDRITMPPNPQG